MPEARRNKHDIVAYAGSPGLKINFVQNVLCTLRPGNQGNVLWQCAKLSPDSNHPEFHNNLADKGVPTLSNLP
jgi:hypothetical protein